jgi:hypothetical protein
MGECAESTASDFRIAIRMWKDTDEKQFINLVVMLKTRVAVISSFD